MQSVYVLIPVHNRLSFTECVIECLRRQEGNSRIIIVIIDDGSTDGTADYLAAQADVVTLKGDGTLFWGGAIQMGLDYALGCCERDDYILFLNDDTQFVPGYVETLVNSSRRNGDAVVGSVVREDGEVPALVSIGARIDLDRILIRDILSGLSPEQIADLDEFYFPDALSGRGTLFPSRYFREFGTLVPHLLPHYFADYEITMRFKRKGVPLVVARDACVFSPPVYGNSVDGMSFFKRYFGPRSSRNLWQMLIFFCRVGTPFQRLTAPLRLGLKSISHARRKQQV
jgi:GT2 family glycosyltransferase